MITINFIGYITNDLNSVSRDTPDDIYIMTSDFKIYNARNLNLILNLPDKFLFFNIVTKNLYKISSIIKCFRNINNNQKYIYGEYVYNYDQFTGFWNSTDYRKLYYLKLIDPSININGYIYTVLYGNYVSGNIDIPIEKQKNINNAKFN